LDTKNHAKPQIETTNKYVTLGKYLKAKGDEKTCTQLTPLQAPHPLSLISRISMMKRRTLRDKSTIRMTMFQLTNQFPRIK
jgi:hypothetical protein